MNPTIRDRWLKALRSGDYKQGMGFLRRPRIEGQQDEFCCLGVLCELAVEDGVIQRREPTDEIDTYQYANEDEPPGYGSTALLPEAVSNWAGIKGGHGFYADHTKSLTKDNDDGKPFSEIAQIIEENF